MFRKFIISILVPAIILSGCATRFSGMSTPASECGYRQSHFDEFTECMKTKFNPEQLSAQTKKDNQYKMSKSIEGDVLDDIRSEFIAGLDDILTQYENKTLIKKGKKSSKTLDKAAYDKFDALTQQCAAKEAAANKQAQTFAAVILLGAAVAGAASYCSNHPCGGSAGQSYSDHQGCCSWHGGIQGGCGIHGHIICNDGQESPTCGC